MYELVPLDRLPAGQVAEIVRLEGRPEHVKRLQEMGLRQGMTVEVLRPGKPCIVRVGSNRLCLRQDSRLSVLVRILQTASNGRPVELQQNDKATSKLESKQLPTTV